MDYLLFSYGRLPNIGFAPSMLTEKVHLSPSPSPSSSPSPSPYPSASLTHSHSHSHSLSLPLPLPLLLSLSPSLFGLTRYCGRLEQGFETRGSFTVRKSRAGESFYLRVYGKPLHTQTHTHTHTHTHTWTLNHNTNTHTHTHTHTHREAEPQHAVHAARIPQLDG